MQETSLPSWFKIQFDLDEEAAEIFGGILMSCGIASWETLDHLPVLDPYAKAIYPELQPDVISTSEKMTFIIYEATEEKAKLRIQEILDICDENPWYIWEHPSSTYFQIQTEDWRNKWKNFFHAFQIDDIWITPSWESEKEPPDVTTTIQIDPGISFGTGTHETTKLCIHGLSNENLNGKFVMDLGCGSGILSIVSILRGASFVTGVDIDPDAIASSLDNLKKNHCPSHKYELFAGDLNQDTKLENSIPNQYYDIIVTNILADIIVDLLPIMEKKLKPDGLIIASGIIDFKLDSVVSTFNNYGFHILSSQKEGEWCMIIAKK